MDSSKVGKTGKVYSPKMTSDKMPKGSMENSIRQVREATTEDKKMSPLEKNQEQNKKGGMIDHTA